MRYRTFGQTGFDLSTVSMGCNRIGDPGVDPDRWPPIVERAIDLGVNFFDTSISYNQGRSEQIVGDVTSRRDMRIYLGTKVGFDIDFERGREFQIKEYSAARILRDVEGSLKRLRRNTIDLYLLHSPSVEVLRTGDWLEALTKLRRDGKLRFWGISTEDHASGLEAIRQGAQVLQVEYDLLDPSAEDELLPAAGPENVGVMAQQQVADDGREFQRSVALEAVDGAPVHRGAHAPGTVGLGAGLCSVVMRVLLLGLGGRRGWAQRRRGGDSTERT